MNKTVLSHHANNTRGFSLVEMAIVLVILGLLIGGMAFPFSAQRDAQNQNETQKQLHEIRDALLGFAVRNNRLPCPASPASSTPSASNGVENPVGGGTCINPLDGFLPGVTLGVGPTDEQGFVIDSWGNRIRYAVSTANNALVPTPVFTTTNGMKNGWTATMTPDLSVCSTSVGSTTGSSAKCSTTSVLTSSAVALIFSTGKNGKSPPNGADEQANQAAHKVFISHTPRQAGSPQGEFDDLVIWISPNVLFHQLISVGRLP